MTENTQDDSNDEIIDDEEIPVEPDGSVYVRTQTGLVAKATDWEECESEGDIKVNERTFVQHAQVPERVLERLGLEDQIDLEESEEEE